MFNFRLLAFAITAILFAPNFALSGDEICSSNLLNGNPTKSALIKEMVWGIYQASKARTSQAEQAVKQFKNSAQPNEGRTFKITKDDLTLSASADFVSLLDAMPSEMLPEPHNFANFGTPKLYEEKVFYLRKGDTLDFGGEKIKLGAFLGAGDATHIYEIEGQDEVVLRIPFGSIRGFSNLAFYWRQMKETADKSLSLSRLRDPMNPEKPLVPYARVIRTDPQNRFLIVQKIRGDENGRDFIQRFEASQSSDKHDRLKRLLRNIEFALIFSGCRLDPSSKSILGIPEKIVTEARQFVWDKKKADWIWADFN
jgi:hypothetical protein